MTIDLTDMLYVLSFALDAVEAELLGVETGHNRRVTFLSILMAKQAGIKDEELRDFAGCCLLHDNALMQFVQAETAANAGAAALSKTIVIDESKMYLHHSVVGEKNIRLLPFRTDVRNIINYHHEPADGTGIMGVSAEKSPLKAQIVHLADVLDVKGSLTTVTRPQFEKLRQWVQENAGTMFSEQAVGLFMQAVSFKDILVLQDKDLYSYFNQVLETCPREYTDDEIHNIADFFATIVDCKSEFTQYHSRGVADKAELMAIYYGFDPEKTIRFYFAGAMHDIGKMMISNDILESTSRLTDAEFKEMKNHAYETYRLLSRIKGIPDIVHWASNHHEKLNGNGYPRGLTSGEISFEGQLLACIDIYQALTEKRPYKDGLSHAQTISIMTEMAKKGEINGQIVRDMDKVMANI